MPMTMCGGRSVSTSHFKYWAAFSVLAIAAVSLTWWDSSDVLHSTLSLIAATTGMMYTMLAGRGRISCYGFGFVNAPLYAYLSWRWGYYGDMALNVYYTAMMLPGLICWRRNMDAGDEGCIVRTRLGVRERIVWSGLVLAGVAALWGMLHAVGGNRPLCDAFTNVFSIAAIVLTVRRCIEQWVLWLAVDAIEMFMWWRTGADSMAILAMWALFFVDGCYCYALWLRRPPGLPIPAKGRINTTVGSDQYHGRVKPIPR